MRGRMLVAAAILLLAGVLTGCAHQPAADLAAFTPEQRALERSAGASTWPTAPQPDTLPGVEHVNVSESAVYAVEQALTVVNRGPGQPAKQNIWIALIRDVPPYQEVLATEITPVNYQEVVDEYGNHYAEFDLNDMPPETTIRIQLKYRVRVNGLAYDLTRCEGPLPEMFTQADLHIESRNPQIVALAGELAQGQETVCEKVRAFYDYIGNHLVYSYNGTDWGAQAALGPMGADCTEYASLMIALSRAAGIPARYLEGLNYFGEKSKSTARTEHAWLEVYLPGVGWAPMDPTLGRSSLTRREYFAALPPDHIIVTRGRNPSTLRGANYWTHLYWPGDSTDIQIKDAGWVIRPVGD